jgi:hypothetical protein
MLPFEDRYTRQRQLPDVGAHGQERIAQHKVTLGNDRPAQIAELYLRRAGVLEVVTADEPERSHGPALQLRFDAAREFGAGCLRALEELQCALRTTTTPRDSLPGQQEHAEQKVGQ